MALGRDADRARFMDATSGAGGVVFTFRTEDLLPTEKTICKVKHTHIFIKVTFSQSKSNEPFFLLYMHNSESCHSMA
jgi:hypothetical protein